MSSRDIALDFFEHYTASEKKSVSPRVPTMPRDFTGLVAPRPRAQRESPIAVTIRISPPAIQRELGETSLRSQEDVRKLLCHTE
jgi:hypothetical protein